MSLRVLAPIDGSELTWKCFERGLALLTGRPGLVVTALNVRQPGFDGAREDTVEAFDTDEHDEIFPNLAASERVLLRAVELGKALGVQVEPLSAEGTHYDVILQEAKNHDVLMMHRLSKSSFRDTVKGSRTEDLARNAGVSILLVSHE